MERAAEIGVGDGDGQVYVSIWEGCSPQLLSQTLGVAVKVLCRCD